MKKTWKKALALTLVLATLVGSLAIPASAANYTTNYSAYNQPESNDYAYWNGRRVVRGSGTTTSEIKWMQAAMNAVIQKRGLNAPYAEVDGSFGPGATRTCKAVQGAFGLKKDGSCGPATIAALKSTLSSNRTSSWSTGEENGVKYTYKTVTLNCSNLDAWKSSVMETRPNLYGAVTSVRVCSYETIAAKVPICGPQLPGQTSYRTVYLKLPCQVQYKLHTHTYNRGYGHNWYYTNNGIQIVETCNCGYRNEGAFWEIPDITDSTFHQSTGSVISGLPQF